MTSAQAGLLTKDDPDHELWVQSDIKSLLMCYHRNHQARAWHRTCKGTECEPGMRRAAGRRRTSGIAPGTFSETRYFPQDFFCFTFDMTVCAVLRVCGVVMKLQRILNTVQKPLHTGDHRSKKTMNCSII